MGSPVPTLTRIVPKTRAVVMVIVIALVIVIIIVIMKIRVSLIVLVILTTRCAQTFVRK